MRAIIVSEHGGPEVLEWRETAAPTAGVGELLVHTAAVGLNFIETYQRSGLYRVPLPFTPGAEASGMCFVKLNPAISARKIQPRGRTFRPFQRAVENCPDPPSRTA